MFGNKLFTACFNNIRLFRKYEIYVHYRSSLQVVFSNYVHNFYCSFIRSTQKISVIRLSISD